MNMDRLSADDQIMLWPDSIWPQEIGALAILDGASLLDPDGRLRLEVVRTVIAARLHLVPRFRQLLYVPGRLLGRPVWVDTSDFDLSQHLRAVPLPPPGDEATLLVAIEELRRHRLARSRPLWEMSFLPGLPDRRVGMFIKMHHVMADGIAAMAAAAAFLDAAPDRPVEPAPPWTPAPAPEARELLVDNLRQHACEVGSALSALTRPATTLRRVRAAWPAMRELCADTSSTRTSLNRMVGPDRNLAIIRGDIDLIRQAAHQHNATVNDVLLTVTAGGLRELMRSREELADNAVVSVYVPVTLRHGPRDNARGNLVGQMVVPLPLGIADPGSRLGQIAAETAARKARNRPSLGKVFRSRIAREALLKLINRKPINVTTADVPGPQQPLYFAGARVLETFPVLPLIANVPLGVGALSYAGQFNIMAVADRDAYPDLDVFAARCQAELREITALTSAIPGA
jgi:diacylglycerol O-acyltransferase / wax synthase